MSFLETPRFPMPPGLGYRSIPDYSVTPITTASGGERRNRNWAQPLHEFEFNLEHAEVDMEGVRDFYHAVGGTSDGFRFKDWNDYRSALAGAAITGTDQPLVLVSGAVYQLTKRYTKGANSTDRDIKKPVTGSILIADGGTLKTETTHYTVDYATGLVTLLFTPAGTMTWGGEFDVPVRFRDKVEFELTFLDDGGTFVQASTIALRELRRGV